MRRILIERFRHLISFRSETFDRKFLISLAMKVALKFAMHGSTHPAYLSEFSNFPRAARKLEHSHEHYENSLEVKAHCSSHCNVIAES